MDQNAMNEKEAELDRYKEKIAKSMERMEEKVDNAELDICRFSKQLAELAMEEDDKSLKIKQELYLSFKIAESEKNTWKQAINQLKVSLTYD